MEKPWETEPDHVEFEHVGYPCILHRGPVGAWCGYVGIPSTHPFYKKEYNSDLEVDVHGGLTYASECQGAICHKVAEGETDDRWWFGFDCSHYGDLWPGSSSLIFDIMNAGGPLRDGVYRDIDYVTAETKKLAEQLSKYLL